MIVRFVLHAVLSAFVTWVIQPEMAWWDMSMVCFFVGLAVGGKAWVAFLGGFAGVGGLWFYKAYSIDVETGSLLASKVAAVFQLPNAMSIIVLTAFVGGLVGGMGVMTGCYLRQLVQK